MFFKIKNILLGFNAHSIVLKEKKKKCVKIFSERKRFDGLITLHFIAAKYNCQEVNIPGNNNAPNITYNSQSPVKVV